MTWRPDWEEAMLATQDRLSPTEIKTEKLSVRDRLCYRTIKYCWHNVTHNLFQRKTASVKYAKRDNQRQWLKWNLYREYKLICKTLDPTAFLSKICLCTFMNISPSLAALTFKIFGLTLVVFVPCGRTILPRRDLCKQMNYGIRQAGSILLVRKTLSSYLSTGWFSPSPL